MHLSQMFEAMERGELRALYCIGENPAESEANATHARHLLEGLDCLVVQDIFRTATAELADVVFPATADWCEYEGTVTNSERRVQRVRKAIDPPGQARPDTHIISALATELGHDWGQPSAEEVWDELRSVSLNWHAGMSYARLDALGGIQWPCPSEDHPGTPLMHARLWADDPGERGRPAPFTPVEHVAPVDALDDDYPIRLTTVSRAAATPLRCAGASRCASTPRTLVVSGSPTASGCASSRAGGRWRRRWRSTRRCGRASRRSRRTSPRRSTSTS
jgi:predicted molibdopterin-dependent oxidoreductase YjgC